MKEEEEADLPAKLTPSSLSSSRGGKRRMKFNASPRRSAAPWLTRCRVRRFGPIVERKSRARDSHVALTLLRREEDILA